MRKDILDCFYNAVHKDIVLYLLRNSNQPDRVELTMGILYDGEKTEDERIIDLIEWTGGRNSEYGKLARDMTDVGLLVVGALEVLGGKSNASIANTMLDEQTLNMALRIYDDCGIEITPKNVVSSLGLGYEEFEKITSKGFSDFQNLLSSAYSSARYECGVEIPEESAGHFLMETVYRHKLPKEVLKVEKAFLDTGYEEWIEKVESGDVSDYTIGIVSKVGCNRPEFIDGLTELPILDTIKHGKTTFVNTFEFKMLSEVQKRKSITQGLNRSLKALEQFHKKNTEREAVKDYVVFFGEDGCLFGDVHVTDYIILNKHVSGWNKGGIMDKNSWYSPIGFLKKIRLLYLDGYVDLGVLEDEWLSCAVNEYISQSAASDINYLGSVKTEISDEEYVIKLKHSREDLEHLEAFSEIGDMFVNEQSIENMSEFKEWLDKEQSCAEQVL